MLPHSRNSRIHWTESMNDFTVAMGHGCGCWSFRKYEGGREVSLLLTSRKPQSCQWLSFDLRLVIHSVLMHSFIHSYMYGVLFFFCYDHWVACLKFLDHMSSHLIYKSNYYSSLFLHLSQKLTFPFLCCKYSHGQFVLLFLWVSLLECIRFMPGTLEISLGALGSYRVPNIYLGHLPTT